MYRFYNPNPMARIVGDCAVRALTKAVDQSWEQVYTQLFYNGLQMCDMPSANEVWGAFLRQNGYYRKMIPDSTPHMYTVKDFCEDHPRGTYVLALSSHVVAVVDGDYYDTWDSGDLVPLYYFDLEA